MHLIIRNALCAITGSLRSGGRIRRLGLAIACAGAAALALTPRVRADADSDAAAAISDQKEIPVYRIHATDKLTVSIYQEDELSRTCRVDSRGTVNLPLIGEVRIVGQTLSGAERTLEAAYRDARILRKPEVTITVEEYAPREVSIQGQVKAPGRFTLPIESSMSVLDLVTKAGGFTDTAKGTEVLITRFLPDGSSHVYKVDVDSIIKGKSHIRKEDDSSMTLEPDDIVYVPQRII